MIWDATRYLKHTCGPGKYVIGLQGSLHIYGVTAEGLEQYHDFIEILIGKEPWSLSSPTSTSKHSYCQNWMRTNTAVFETQVIQDIVCHYYLLYCV